MRFRLVPPKAHRVTIGGSPVVTVDSRTRRCSLPVLVDGEPRVWEFGTAVYHRLRDIVEAGTPNEGLLDWLWMNRIRGTPVNGPRPIEVEVRLDLDRPQVRIERVPIRY